MAINTSVLEKHEMQEEERQVMKSPKPKQRTASTELDTAPRQSLVSNKDPSSFLNADWVGDCLHSAEHGGFNLDCQRR